MELFPTPPVNTRLGIHYFPDSLHYRESDLAVWLPELHLLGISWIILEAPTNRAIPEGFLRGLISSGVEPVIHFKFPPGSLGCFDFQAQDLRLLFEIYASWGVHYVVLFDRPNLRQNWSGLTWAQPNLVERFLDLYLPLAGAILNADLYPVFPPLDPGGDFWDTAFLRLALQGIQRRGQSRLLDRLVLGAYAWSAGRPLQWGAGGPERWPAARPYLKSQADQDHRGFRIFDWYLAIARAVLNKSLPLLILGGGSRVTDNLKATSSSSHPAEAQAVVSGHINPLDQHARINSAIAALMLSDEEEILSIRDPMDGSILEVAPEEVLVYAFWLLSASEDSPHVAEAWFQPDGRALPVVSALQQMIEAKKAGHWGRFGLDAMASGKSTMNTLTVPSQDSASLHKPINHYLWLPSYAWGVSDWHLDLIRPLIKKYHPTVGFSLEEACFARRVTLVGGPQSISEEHLRRLRRAGCVVQWIGEDGMEIATE